MLTTIKNCCRSFLLLGVVFLLLSPWPALGAERPKVLRIGLIPADDAAEMLRKYEGVRAYLAERLGVEVTVKVTMDYNAAIEAMRAKHIDMAWFGPFSYVLAAKHANAEAIAIGIRRGTTSATYHTVFLTHPGSGIEGFEDLKGKTFSFVDPASTSGNLIPRFVLKEKGVDPEKDFKTYFYAGTHNASTLAVANRKVDAGVDSDNSLNRMIREGQVDKDKVVVFYKSDPIPGSPLAVRADLPEAFKNEIRKALVEMHLQAKYKVHGWGNIERYIEAKDSDYEIIRQVAEVLHLDLRKK